ncbi:2-phospho-L-lactate guanylyltransferase [Haloplanus rubicundus]|uniref:2-phospho-L-lactate guanylyltransferase n=1 Tax=Haloplanus rubicundus TaxID=1547898 RepID=A0A345EGT3_9EURY|nr:2-phospho-L-lactate guanylyltransferase [Haloplanus rubicundus]AXG07992.1 2-phospho-L-lactate guanylyltransferase [Haloplanus rubicundus]AXG11405.1 2-phospho-L-lactate guanylyltransferase [Haloplanus rubicundus]
MRILVPFEATDPKTRLDGVLDADEREDVARAMLRDVLDACLDAGHDPEVIATAPVEVADAPVTVDDRPLSAAVNARLGGAEPLGVVVADLALATPRAVDRLVDVAADADVAIAPGRGGGTNGLVIDHPDFRVDFHGVSYRDHVAAAREVGADIAVVDSMRLSTDVDEPTDLVEVLLHGEGEAAAWLGARFELDAGEGRVGLDRVG